MSSGLKFRWVCILLKLILGGICCFCFYNVLTYGAQLLEKLGIDKATYYPIFLSYIGYRVAGAMLQGLKEGIKEGLEEGLKESNNNR